MTQTLIPAFWYQSGQLVPCPMGERYRETGKYTRRYRRATARFYSKPGRRNAKPVPAEWTEARGAPEAFRVDNRPAESWPIDGPSREVNIDSTAYQRHPFGMQTRTLRVEAALYLPAGEQPSASQWRDMERMMRSPLYPSKT